MKAITKKQIQKVLKTFHRTQIFNIAKKCGVDVSKRHLVLEFVQSNAPTLKIYKSAYSIAYFSHKKNRDFYFGETGNETPIIRAIRHALYEKKQGSSNYSKKLIIGNKNIYWASPCYGHADYNKSIAFENTEKNRRVASLINRYLGYK